MCPAAPSHHPRLTLPAARPLTPALRVVLIALALWLAWALFQPALASRVADHRPVAAHWAVGSSNYGAHAHTSSPPAA